RPPEQEPDPDLERGDGGREARGSMSDAWDPRQYERFAAERRQPFVDLAALLRPNLGMKVVDLGCGTGEATRDLHRQLGAAETVGLDSSPAMLDKAAAHAGSG